MSVTSEHSLREHWQTQAYIVVRRLIEPSEAAAMLDVCEDILGQWRAGIGPERNESTATRRAVSMRHLNHPDYFKERPEGFRMMMDLIADERLLSVVREIVDDEPQFFCTTLFFNPLENSHDGNWHRVRRVGHRRPNPFRERNFQRTNWRTGSRRSYPLLCAARK